MLTIIRCGVDINQAAPVRTWTSAAATVRQRLAHQNLRRQPDSTTRQFAHFAGWLGGSDTDTIRTNPTETRSVEDLSRPILFEGTGHYDSSTSTYSFWFIVGLLAIQFAHLAEALQYTPRLMMGWGTEERMGTEMTFDIMYCCSFHPIILRGEPRSGLWLTRCL